MKLVSGALGDGVATLAVKPPFPGIRTYTATYISDGTYEASSATAQLTVTVPPSASSCGLGSSSYVLSSGAATPSQSAFSSSLADQSAVCAQNSGTVLTLNSPIITKSGADTFTESSAAYSGDPSGIDAGVLAYGNSASSPSGAIVNLHGTPAITATSAGYAAFASGDGAAVNVSNATIASTTSGATLGAGFNGQINISDSTVNSDATAVTILNGGSVFLKNTLLATSNWNAIELSGPGAGTNTETHFHMSGGAIASSHPLIDIAGNQTIDVYLSKVDLSGLTINPQQSWDSLPSDSTAALSITLDDQTMRGQIDGTAASTLALENGSSLDGDFTGGGSISIDRSSSWTIHSSFKVQTFHDPDGISGSTVLNITGNGQTISYSNALNPSLGGLTYTLKGGGSLKPY